MLCTKDCQYDDIAQKRLNSECQDQRKGKVQSAGRKRLMPALCIGVRQDVFMSLPDFRFAGVVMFGTRYLVQFFKAVDDAVIESQLARHSPQAQNHTHQSGNGAGVAEQMQDAAAVKEDQAEGHRRKKAENQNSNKFLIFNAEHLPLLEHSLNKGYYTTNLQEMQTPDDFGDWTAVSGPSFTISKENKKRRCTSQ